MLAHPYDNDYGTTRPVGIRPPVDLTPRQPVAPTASRPTPYEQGGITGRTPSRGSGYVSDPLVSGYVNFGQHAISRLMQPQAMNPILAQAIQALTSMSNSRGPSVDTSFLREFGDTVRKRQGELNQPGLSASQQDILRTNVTDPLEAQRDAARQQVVEHFAAKGFTPDSGIVQQALLDSDRKFSQLRTENERTLAIKQMDQDESRKNQAVDIGQILAQLGLSTEGLNVQAQTAGRGQALSAAGSLAGIGSDLQQEPIQRLLQAFGISSQLGQLPFQIQGNQIAALNAMNNTPIPQADSNAQIIQLLLSLADRGEGVYQNAQANNGSFWNVLGQSLPSLLDSFSTLFKPKTPTPGVQLPKPTRP